MARSTAVGVLVFLISVHTSTAAGARIGSFPVATKFWLERAVIEAARRIQHPECQRVLSEFADPSGVAISTKLAGLGLSAEKYLTASLYFVDGTGEPQCDSRLHVAAFTQRGRRTVFICPPLGFDAAFSASGRSVAVIIHEMLHSLGLGENPPSSRDITAAVVRRCGA